MLQQRYRDLLIQTISGALPAALDCQNLVNGVRAGSWSQIVPMNAAYANAIPLLVDAADEQNWLRDLVKRLVDTFAARAEFSAVLVEIDRTATVRTVLDPFEEVWLEGDRPFVNRRPLRAQLLNLTNQAGSSVLLVDGGPQSGKTFSFYLINHVAPTKGFKVSKFRMMRLPKPDDLAAEILGRLGADRPLPAIGNESAERWAEKLADIVAHAIEGQKSLRMFVFDEFSDTPLPDGTVSFIIRLATYADEELRPYLRVVLMRFRGTLPQELDDVALRDDAAGFTSTDMVAVVMQIAAARLWSVTETVVKEKIDDFHRAPGRTLNDRFKFLRGLLQQLSARSP